MEDSQQNTVLIIGKEGKWNLPSLSPFSLQLETFLKISNLNYTLEYWSNDEASPTGSLSLF